MTDANARLKPREDAGRASAENGLVFLDGPDGVAVTMTAAAAAQTAESLQAAAQLAQWQLAQAPPAAKPLDASSGRPHQAGVRDQPDS